MTSIKSQRPELPTDSRQLLRRSGIELGSVYPLLDASNWRLGLADEQHQTAGPATGRCRSAHPSGRRHDHKHRRDCLIAIRHCHRTGQRPSSAARSRNLPLISVPGLRMDCTAPGLKHRPAKRPSVCSMTVRAPPPPGETTSDLGRVQAFAILSARNLLRFLPQRIFHNRLTRRGSDTRSQSLCEGRTSRIPPG